MMRNASCVIMVRKCQAVIFVTATRDILTVKQKQVLMALARVLPEEKLFSSAFLQKHNLGSASTIQRTLRSLIEKDLIDKDRDVYTIIDVFFKKWLSQL